MSMELLIYVSRSSLTFFFLLGKSEQDFWRLPPNYCAWWEIRRYTIFSSAFMYMVISPAIAKGIGNPQNIMSLPWHGFLNFSSACFSSTIDKAGSPKSKRSLSISIQLGDIVHASCSCGIHGRLPTKVHAHCAGAGSCQPWFHPGPGRRWWAYEAAQ